MLGDLLVSVGVAVVDGVLPCKLRREGCVVVVSLLVRAELPLLLEGGRCEDSV